jgi:hypothetical protein
VSRDRLPAAGAVGSGTPVKILPQAVRVPRRPLRAIAIGWATAFLPAVALGAVLTYLFPGAQTPQFPFQGAVAIFLLVIFAPVIETLIMGAVLLILLRLMSQSAAIMVSALGWAFFHSLEVPIWGFVIWWPFLVFSTLFVAWRGRSILAAFAIPATVHALNNLIPAMPVAFPELFGA